MEELKELIYTDYEESFTGFTNVCPYCEEEFLIGYYINFCPMCGQKVHDPEPAGFKIKEEY